MKTILAIETSCDDCAAALVDETGRVLSDVIFSQVDEHLPFGGVVPEIGSRAHIEQIRHVVKKAFDDAKLGPSDLSAVAATFAPGLIGPLLVGAQFAKGLACAQNIPLIAVHHIEGHVMAGFGEDNFPKAPFLALVASGGHSALYRVDDDGKITCLGQTLDDAAGETFDKVGRALNLPYPAGKIIDELAKAGDKNRFEFPIAMRFEKRLDFSFSGLKTRALETLKKLSPLHEKDRADFCASLQEAICLALSERAMSALKQTGLTKLAIGGGVAANSRLREMLTQWCTRDGVDLYIPSKRFCTDNAIMIGRAAAIKINKKLFANYDTEVLANLPIERKEELNSATKNFI